MSAAEEVTEIKVYSNAEEVALYVDGAFFEKQKAHRVFRFSVPLSGEDTGVRTGEHAHTGEHTIEARAAGQHDIIKVRRVEQPNPSYVFVKKQDVVNWFDREEFDPDCYSVSDTLADLRANPEAGAIVNRMMEKGAASRGDVAEAVKDNPGLQRMMGRMTLISLLKQAGDIDEETVRQLNRVLQKIRKDG